METLWADREQLGLPASTGQFPGPQNSARISDNTAAIEDLSALIPFQEPVEAWRAHLSNNTRKAALIEWMINRGMFVYYDPEDKDQNLQDIKPKLIRRLTTEVLVYPQDLAPGAEEHLKSKINDRLHTHGSLQDYHVYNAFSAIHKEYNKFRSEKIYLIGGAAEWFSELAALNPKPPIDEATGAPMTFFSACRKCGFLVDAHDPTPKTNKEKCLRAEQLRDKLHDVFKLLGIEHHPEVRKFIRDWKKKGTFTINGETHSQKYDPQKKILTLTGAYTERTKTICNLHNHRPNDNAELSSLISHMQQMTQHIRAHDWSGESESPDKMLYNYAQAQIKNTSALEKMVDLGYQARFKLVLEAIQRAFAGEKCAPLSTKGRKAAREILSRVDEDELLIMALEDYTIACTRTGNVEPLSPERPLPGTTPEEHKTAITSIGNNAASFRTMFISDGEDGMKLSHKDRLMRLGMVLMHEAIHVAFAADDIMSDVIFSGERAKLFQQTPDSRIGKFKSDLREAYNDLKEMPKADKDKYMGWVTFTMLKIPIMRLYGKEKLEGDTYDYKQKLEEDVCNSIAIASTFGEYGPYSRLGYNIYNNSRLYGDDEPPAVTRFRNVIEQGKNLFHDIAEKLLEESKYQIPGVNAPLEHVTLIQSLRDAANLQTQRN